MTNATRPQRYRRSSWAAGLLVLVGLTWTIWTLLATARPGMGARASVADGIPVQEPAPAAPRPTVTEPSRPARPVVRRIEGLVRQPSGEPASGATVTVHRATTAAPEWRSEQLDQAITGADGTFVFGLPVRDGLLIEFYHPSFAGDLVEVPRLRDRLELDLAPGYDLAGIVRNNFGAPLGGVQVAVEAMLDQNRRVAVTTTTTSGGYRFANLRAGLVRVVARHERWQAVSNSVLCGETQQTDLSFLTPAAAPLRGRVVTTGQVPIADAELELLATNGRPGLVDPISARSAEDGSFVLAGLSRGPMSLFVRHPEHGMLRRTISVGFSPTETVLELPPRSEVSGHLQIEGVEEVEEADVGRVALRMTDAAGEIHYTETDAEGGFAFDRPLSPGRGTMAVPGGRLAFARSQSFELSVQVQEQPRTVLELTVARPTEVRGRCVDADVVPLVGVLVFGSKQLTASRLIGSNLASFIGTVGQEVALTLSSASDSLLAVSGPDGTFTFTGQEPGALLLRYELPAHAKRSQRCTVPAAGTMADLGDVVMFRGCQVTGVVLRGRRPLAGATVSVVGDDSQATAITGRGGRFEVADLMPGSYRVRARLPSMPAGHAEETVVLAVDTAVPELTLELPAGRTLRGVVKGFDGQPIANALVSVRGAGGQPTVTDASGSFSLELPAARDIELEVSTADQSRTVRRTVRAFQQDLTIQLDAPPTSTLVARIAGLPGRTRLPAVMLRIKRRGGNIVGDDRPRWVEVQNGELRWPLCPVGRCRVEIRCEGYSPYVTDLVFAANEEQQLDEILLEPGARVRGVVVDAAGNPIPNARVFVGDEADLDVFEAQVRSAADGSFEVRGVSSRSSSLVAYAAGYSPNVRQLSLPRDVLQSNGLELVLEPGAVISVEVRDAPESGLVQLLRGGRLLASAVLDDTGRAEFVDRAPGEYSVRLYGTEGAPQPVRVTNAGESVKVELE